MTRNIKGSIKLEPGNAPTASKGVLYFDTGSDKFLGSQDGATFVELGAGGQFTFLPKTSDHTITTGESDGFTVFTNEGAAGLVIFSLPAATQGLIVRVINAAGQDVQIDADTGDKIYTESEQSGVDSVENSIKSGVIYLHAVNNTDWIALDEGAWTEVITEPFGFFGGGNNGATQQNVIDYIDTSLTTQNATDTGDLTVARQSLAGVSNATNGFFGGGKQIPTADQNTIDFILVTTATQNATDTGDLTVARQALAGVQGATNGFFNGGIVSDVTVQNIIDFIVLGTTTQNATDTGDLTIARRLVGGVEGSTNGFIGGGNT